VSFTTCMFTQNTAGGARTVLFTPWLHVENGGAVYFNGGTISLTNCSFAANTASSTDWW